MACRPQRPLPPAALSTTSPGLFFTRGPHALGPSSNPRTVLALVPLRHMLTRLGGWSQALQEEDLPSCPQCPIHVWWLSRATEPASTCPPSSRPCAGGADSGLFGVLAQEDQHVAQAFPSREPVVSGASGPGAISKTLGSSP